MALLANGAQLKKNAPHIYESMGRLRHRIFKEQLKWDVNSDNGLELDEFDHDETIYVLYIENDQVKGNWRLLPTKGPYMMSEVFPHLAPPGGIPREDNLWELSRYAMDKDSLSSRNHFQHAKMDMFCTLAEFCLMQRIEELILVQDPRITILADGVFGVSHVETEPVQNGLCKAHTVIYRPPFLRNLRQTQKKFGFQAPHTNWFDINHQGVFYSTTQYNSAA